jgi:hypothetical protein
MAPSLPDVPREAESTTRTASSSSTSCYKQSNRGALNRRRFRRFLLRPRQTSSPIPSPSDVLRLHQPRQRLPGVSLDLLDLVFVSFPLSFRLSLVTPPFSSPMPAAGIVLVPPSDRRHLPLTRAGEANPAPPSSFPGAPPIDRAAPVWPR